MWPFKKKKIEIDSKFKIMDRVTFPYNKEYVIGRIHEIREENGEILYTVQVMGQCPWFAYNVKESDIKFFEQPKFEQKK